MEALRESREELGDKIDERVDCCHELGELFLLLLHHLLEGGLGA